MQKRTYGEEWIWKKAVVENYCFYIGNILLIVLAVKYRKFLYFIYLSTNI